MSKVTSKLQLTIPKAIATKLGIRPGDEVDWVLAGESLRVVPRKNSRDDKDLATGLRIYDTASRRQAKRQASRSYGRTRDRGWTREDLYSRAGSR